MMLNILISKKNSVAQVELVASLIIFHMEDYRNAKL